PTGGRRRDLGVAAGAGSGDAAAEVVEQVDAGDQAEETVAFGDDGDLAAVEDGQQGFDRGFDVQHVELAGHGGGDRVVEALFVAVDVHQHVGFVEDADDAVAVHHRQLGDFVQLHALVGHDQFVGRGQD